MSGRLVAGVDCSTQATKVLIVDPDTGEVVATGRAPHEVTGDDGARETDPRTWWTALGQALAETGRAADVGAIAVGGQQHGLVTMDASGAPIRPAMLWNDTRAAPDAAWLTERLGAERWAALTGLRPVASFTVSKWAWLRRTEPDAAARTRAIRLPHDYMTQRLAGRGVTDRGDASGTGWWTPSTGAYADEILGLTEVAIDRAMLPALLGPTEAAGTVTAAAAAELGLPDGVVVGPGTGDNMAAALGVGLRVGQPALSLGTSGTVFAVSERPTADPSGVVAGFADASGRFLPLAATLNCTLAVDRMAGWLGLDREDVAPSDSVVVLPFLDGERTPDVPGASGTVTGLRHESTPQQVLMATYEGAVASLLEALGSIEALTGISDPATPVVLVGGGARGAAWREVVGRLSGRPLLIPDAAELVALGAAVQACATWRDEAPADVAARWGTASGTVVEPRTADRERLARIAEIRDAIVGSPALSGSGRQRPA
ncbi:MAG TPA: xylulokinase [Candidatus Limnocylindrales bacterium]